MRLPGEGIVDEGAWALFYMTQAMAILLLVLHNSIMVLQVLRRLQLQWSAPVFSFSAQCATQCQVSSR